MHDTGCSGLVHWDDPEGWYGKGGGRGVQDGEHMYTRGGFMSSLAPHERLPEVLVVPREKTPRALQPEETHETPPSSRAEGLLFLPGLESNPESSLQTEEEARHP